MTEPQILKFVSRTSDPEDGHTPACWFIFQGDKLLVQHAGQRAGVPLAADITALGLALTRRVYLGYLRGGAAAQTPCYAAEIAEDAAVPADLAADGLRQLYGQLDETQFSLAGRAIQIVAWDRTHQFCGQCGGPTETIPTERAKLCPRCGLTSYPRLSPAIIIAVVRATADGPRLLLARNHRFPAGRYSVVAGFVEPGETLEECAGREVAEEVGIQIKNVRYFGSQPWPFPNSLMIGFTAEYAGGEFELEAAEIAEAGWFAADALPGLPPKMSIARRLIDWFADGGAGA
ncbi:MAG: NAD-capped hydrolase NudC [Chloroflexota bacterium]|nr:NAD-capped hydrolase NudC [Chloroflexota bacterium]